MSQSEKLELMKKVERSPEFRQFFANGMRVRLGDNDVSLTFTVQSDAPDGKLYISDQAQAIMTPKTFKILALSTQRLVEALEAHMGEIVLTKEQIDGIANIASLSLRKSE